MSQPLEKERESGDKPVMPEGYDELSMPPHVDVPLSHPLWPKIDAALRSVYDPEIPVNVFELGLIYKVEALDGKDGKTDFNITMTLTSPACPVAQEMPGMLQGAIFPVEGVGEVDVKIIWDPPWNPGLMAETAKLQLNMFT